MNTVSTNVQVVTYGNVKIPTIMDKRRYGWTNGDDRGNRAEIFTPDRCAAAFAAAAAGRISPSPAGGLWYDVADAGHAPAAEEKPWIWIFRHST
jgi:hypothetical protein